MTSSPAAFRAHVRISGRARRASRAALGSARELAAGHPRHVLLAALTAGLLLGPRWPPSLAAAALVGVLLARGAMLAVGVVAALLAGAAIADVRLAGLDRTELAPLLGREVDVRATLLEHPRERSFGVRVAAVGV
ncbi:MAG: competence protein ComEC, partial [Solirubrobacteraceae bacterium]|nr:competence protein ComEC [Solirubrobacteraceae bacterium]